MHTNPSRPRHRPRWMEMSVALAALVVSAVSLYIARQQTEVMHRQLAASIWPAMQFYMSNLPREGDPVIVLTLENVGVGPARIYSFTISHQDESVPDLGAFIVDCCTPENTTLRAVSSFVEGRILPAGDRIDFLELPASWNHPSVFQGFDRIRTELDVELCYCSVLEECWTRSWTRQGGGDPEPVASCRV